jgi:ribosomal protein S18 acetylase RimI-like enzyme
MEIARYQAATSEALCAAYNALVADVPHCFPVSVPAFAEALAPAIGEGAPKGRVRDEVVFVAREGDVILGFLHAGVAEPKEESQSPEGVVRFFDYQRGERATGQALLDAGHEYLRSLGQRVVKAFCSDLRYRFYHVACAYLSNRLDHVQALLQFNGYEPFGGEIIFDWPDYAPPEPESSDVHDKVEVLWKPGRGRLPGIEVIARVGEAWAGACKCVSCGEFSDEDAAQDWLFVSELNVAEAHQGRRLGMHLLQAALKEMHAKGYRNASISTDWRNYRAFLFYSNVGFREVDWTLGFSRELET